jgi:hypothetical protein
MGDLPQEVIASEAKQSSLHLIVAGLLRYARNDKKQENGD